MTLIHDSRNAKFRSPMGALPCGEKVRLYIETDAPEAILRLWTDAGEIRLPMERAENGFSRDITLPQTPGIVWYYFILGDVFYGNASDDLGGMGEMYRHEPPSFQITVYDPAYKTPNWLGDGIMMQIMPDRFFRGGDNPVRGRLHADWYEMPELRITENGDNAADDFFGGDLKGITQKLPYIRSLGVTVIYLNPIFLSRSNHKYDTSDYMRIDPAFGTDDDLRKLCETAKSMGIRIILDGVFSHTGDDSVYFNKYGSFDSVGAYQSQTSPYSDWYTFTNWPDGYKSWWGFDTLPNVDKTSRSFSDFIIENDDSVLAHWLKMGVSGWRLDVADELPMDFIARFRKRMKSEDPDSALIGEVWEDPSRKIAYGKLRSYCLGDTLDSVMNYPLRDALFGFLMGEIPSHACARMIASLLENTPRIFHRSLMNLLGSHDKPRAISVLSGAGNMEPDRKYRHPMTLTDAQYSLGTRRLIAAWRAVCALPGMPCIYYGDEAGMTGMSDPYSRGAFPWGREDVSLTESFRNAASERMSDRAWTDGDTTFECPSDDVIIIRRTLNGHTRSLRLDRTLITAEYQ